MTKIRPGQIDPKTGNADKYVRVNSAGTAVEFIAGGGATADAEFVRDTIGAALVAGANITITVNDAGDTITIAGGAGYTDEQARDAIGAALVAGAGVTITVDDALDAITVAVDTAAEYERLLDFLSGTTAAGEGLVAGSGVTLTYDDTNNKITIAASSTGATGGHTLKDEGTALTQRTGLNFVGTGVTVTDDSPGDQSVVTIPGGGDDIPPWSYAGGLALLTGPHRWYNDTGSAITIVSVRASVGSAPAGASIIVDANKNGTTIFTTQGNRPAIAAGSFTALGTPDVVTVAPGDYLTVDIDQIGSSVAGANLVIQINT